MVTKQKNYDLDGGETLVSRVTSDCEFSSKFFATVFNIVTVVISSVMYLLQMWLINRKVTAWVLLFIPACVILGGAYTLCRFLVAIKTQEKLSEATAYLAERTKDLNLIKISNAQQYELEKGGEYFKAQAKIQYRLGFVTMFLNVIKSVNDVTGKVLPFAVGAVMVASGELTVGNVVVLNTLFANIAGVFSNLITYAGDFKEANGALARVALFMEEDTEELDKGEEAPQQEEDLVFDDVRFGYTQKAVLKSLACSIPKKKVTAIVGTNGSGKSTMFKILTRLYEPNEGSLMFGSSDAASYTLHSWRKKVCLIAQGSPMMEGTIRENICYGREDKVSEEELMKAAKLSHVYDFVKDLPDGFDTEVAAGGGNFSGGQKQCIAIARAMLSKADYLLLDESTGNLDVKREKDVMDAMTELMKGRTTVIIAHSLSAIRSADYVIVLHNGRLEAEGAPAQILTRTGNYLEKMSNRRRFENMEEARG